jgi:hypothetical protein
MYFFYGLTGIVDLMLFFNFKLPKDLDYVALCVAVMAEGILFKFHFFGKYIVECDTFPEIPTSTTNPIDAQTSLTVGSIGNPFTVNVALDTNIELLF